MASLNNTNVPTTPRNWVSALFQVLSPSHAPLRTAVFASANTATVGGIARNDSPSDQGSPTTIPSPADQLQWPSSAAITAFTKSYTLSDPIDELARGSTSSINATGSGTRSRRSPPPAKLAGPKIPVDYGSHRKSFWLNVIQTLGSDHCPARMPFPLLPTPAIDGTEELEIRPSKKKKGEGGQSKATLLTVQTRTRRRQRGEAPTNPRLDRGPPNENKGKESLLVREMRPLPRPSALRKGKTSNLAPVTIAGQVPMPANVRRNPVRKPTQVTKANGAINPKRQQQKGTVANPAPPVGAKGRKPRGLAQPITTRGAEAVTPVQMESRRRRQPLLEQLKSGEDTGSASQQKQPRTKAKAQQAAKKNGTETTKRNLRSEVLPRTRKGANAKSAPHGIPSLPPQAEDDGPESEDEE
jgi:hypothetical protein